VTSAGGAATRVVLRTPVADDAPAFLAAVRASRVLRADWPPGYRPCMSE